MARDHKGIAYREGQPGRDGKPRDHRVDPDPARKRCRTCGDKAMYVRRSYGPHGRAGHWQHAGDGLAQYRSWHTAAQNRGER